MSRTRVLGPAVRLGGTLVRTFRTGGRLTPTIVAALLLAACGDLPTSGTVEAGEPIRAQNGERAINILAASPQEGDD